MCFRTCVHSCACSRASASLPKCVCGWECVPLSCNVSSAAPQRTNSCRCQGVKHATSYSKGISSVKACTLVFIETVDHHLTFSNMLCVGSGAGVLLGCTSLTTQRVHPDGWVFHFPSMSSIQDMSMYDVMVGRYRLQWQRDELSMFGPDRVGVLHP